MDGSTRASCPSRRPSRSLCNAFSHPQIVRLHRLFVRPIQFRTRLCPFCSLPTSERHRLTLHTDTRTLHIQQPHTTHNTLTRSPLSRSVHQVQVSASVHSQCSILTSFIIDLSFASLHDLQGRIHPPRAAWPLYSASPHLASYHCCGSTSCVLAVRGTESKSANTPPFCVQTPHSLSFFPLLHCSPYLLFTIDHAIQRHFCTRG